MIVGVEAAVDARRRLRPVTVDFPISLWLVDLSVVATGDEVSWLVRAEVNRAVRFRDPRHRSRYLAAHVALRLAVDRGFGIPPARQLYACDTLGRWRLIDAGGLDISLSYAGAHAIIALKRGARVGVDIECAGAALDADQLAETCFDAGERAAYDALPAGDRSAAFLRGWTRKEAALKAIGIGLQRAPETLHVGLSGRCRTESGVHTIDIASFEAPGLIGAVAMVAG